MKRHVINDSGKLSKLNWMFLIHTLRSDVFSIFSKYIPAKPESTQAPSAALKPRTRFCSTEICLDSPPCESCTRATPITRISSEPHCVLSSFFRSIVTAKMNNSLELHVSIHCCNQSHLRRVQLLEFSIDKSLDMLPRRDWPLTRTKGCFGELKSKMYYRNRPSNN